MSLLSAASSSDLVDLVLDDHQSGGHSHQLSLPGSSSKCVAKQSAATATSRREPPRETGPSAAPSVETQKRNSVGSSCAAAGQHQQRLPGHPASHRMNPSATWLGVPAFGRSRPKQALASGEVLEHPEEGAEPPQTAATPPPPTSNRLSASAPQ